MEPTASYFLSLGQVVEMSLVTTYSTAPSRVVHSKSVSDNIILYELGKLGPIERLVELPYWWICLEGSLELINSLLVDLIKQCQKLSSDCFNLNQKNFIPHSACTYINVSSIVLSYKTPIFIHFKVTELFEGGGSLA